MPTIIPEFDELEARHLAALKALREANEAATRLALLVIAVKVTTLDPTCRVLAVDDCDDEDGAGRLTPTLPERGPLANPDVESDLWDICSTLDDTNKHIWGGFAKGGLRKHTNRATLDLDLILTTVDVP